MLAERRAPASARQAHYKRNGKAVFAGSNPHRAVAKLNRPGEKSKARNK
jgi:hypothetical protein